MHAATAIAGAERDPTVLHWRAIASYRAQGLRACRQPLFTFAWLAPERLQATLAEIDDPQLQRDWSAFQTACDWLEPTDQTPAWFPAWYLVEHQAALAALDGMHPLPPCRPAQTFAAISRLLRIEPQGHGPALIEARAELRSVDPEFFAFYMARRSLLDGWP